MVARRGFSSVVCAIFTFSVLQLSAFAQVPDPGFEFDEKSENMAAAIFECYIASFSTFDEKVHEQFEKAKSENKYKDDFSTFIVELGGYRRFAHQAIEICSKNSSYGVLIKNFRKEAIFSAVILRNIADHKQLDLLKICNSEMCGSALRTMMENAPE